MKNLKFVLRLLIGAFFIVTAIFKLMSLDNFEIYIYSFNWFGFLFASFAARAVIAAELLLGSLLIFKILYKPAWWATMAMMGGFTLLLVYVALFRNDASCHCMGDIVEVNPTMSIVKNIVTIALLLLVREEKDYRFKGKTAVGICLTIASLAVPFALFPMDSVYNLFDKKEYKVNDELLADFMQDSLAQSLDIDQGNYVLGYLASGCEYCKTSAQKIHTIVENNQLDSSRVIFFIWGDKKDVDLFKQETKAVEFRYVEINPVLAVNLVFGQFPTYVMVSDGQIQNATDIRGLNDKEITDFLTK